MIDIHTHILPRLDDGATSIDDTLELAEMASMSGVDTLIATPHCNQVGRFENYWSAELERYFRLVCGEIMRHRIPVSILPGMEIFADGNLSELLNQKRIIGLNHTNYFLVEFAFDAPKSVITEYLRVLLRRGKIPVIAHPERYFCVQEQPGIVLSWISMGCLTQLNKGSLLGRFGNSVEFTAFHLLREEYVSCIASDAHSPKMRTTHMGEITTYLQRHFGEGSVYELLEENPRRMMSGKPVYMHARESIPRKRFF